MAKYVVAMFLKYNCYNWFRVVDTDTNTFEDIPSTYLFHKMTYGLNRTKIENLRVDYDRDSFKFVCCDDSRICSLDENGEPRVNADGIVLVGIDGDYAYVANWKGQIIRAHMLQIANNVKNKKVVLCNAVVENSGRIRFREK